MTKRTSQMKQSESMQGTEKLKGLISLTQSTWQVVHNQKVRHLRICLKCMVVGALSQLVRQQQTQTLLQVMTLVLSLGIFGTTTMVGLE